VHLLVSELYRVHRLNLTFKEPKGPSRHVLKRPPIFPLTWAIQEASDSAFIIIMPEIKSKLTRNVKFQPNHEISTQDYLYINTTTWRRMRKWDRRLLIFCPSRKWVFSWQPRHLPAMSITQKDGWNGNVSYTVKSQNPISRSFSRHRSVSTMQSLYLTFKGPCIVSTFQ